MDPLISEFSYGYALTHEIETKPGACPVFPSLSEEGHVGFDVGVETPTRMLFLQFKLSHILTNSLAKEYGAGQITSLPYYRFYLHRRDRSAQHDLLMSLEDSGLGDVLYCAPMFHTLGELEQNYLDKSVINQSIFFSPRELGTQPDNKQHYVSFEYDSPHGYFCSDLPMLVKRSWLPSWLFGVDVSFNSMDDGKSNRRIIRSAFDWKKATLDLLTRSTELRRFEDIHFSSRQSNFGVFTDRLRGTLESNDSNDVAFWRKRFGYVSRTVLGSEVLFAFPRGTKVLRNEA